jgi:hypothetical protein
MATAPAAPCRWRRRCFSIGRRAWTMASVHVSHTSVRRLHVVHVYLPRTRLAPVAGDRCRRVVRVTERKPAREIEWEARSGGGGGARVAAHLRGADERARAFLQSGGGGKQAWRVRCMLHVCNAGCCVLRMKRKAQPQPCCLYPCRLPVLVPAACTLAGPRCSAARLPGSALAVKRAPTFRPLACACAYAREPNARARARVCKCMRVRCACACVCACSCVREERVGRNEFGEHARAHVRHAAGCLHRMCTQLEAPRAPSFDREACGFGRRAAQCGSPHIPNSLFAATAP